MAANTVTYFGDVTTAGNTIVFQNLTSQGNYSIFSGNVNPAVTGTTSLTTTGALFTSNSNTTSLNVTSLYATTGSSIGLGGAGSGASLNVTGNAWVSNALSGPNVFATTSANIATLNTAFIRGPLGFVGIGTTASGATLNVYGNFWASNALSTPKVFATTSANLASLNTSAIFGTAGLVGINTTASASWTLNVAGNVWTSNTIGAQNVFATSFANVTNLITTTIVSTTGFVGLNCAGGGATLNVAGNVWASNSLATPNVFATVNANVASLNTEAIFGTTSFVGIKTIGGGATLNIAGNVWVSNALATPNVFATTSANAASLNTTAIIGTTGFVGINTTGAGAALNVAGNVWISNSLSTPNVFATTRANLASLNTRAIFGTTGFVGINTTGAGATLNVLGNVWISNALTTTNVLPTMNANIVSTLVTSMNLFTAGLGINGPAQAGTTLPGGAPFFIGGTLNGTAAPVNSAPTSNLALQFGTASTSYVDMGTTSPAHVNINTTSIFVEAWIYATTTTGLINIASYGNGTSSGWNMQVRPDGGGTTNGLYVRNSKNNVQGVGTFGANQWTYVAFQINGGGGSSRIYAWLSSGATSGSPDNSTTGTPADYLAADPFYLGAVNGVGGFSSGNLYIRDLRIISGAAITLTGTFTQDQAPFAAAVPSYVTGTSLVYSWGLQASSNLYQVPQPLVKVSGNIWCSNAFQSGNVLFTNVLAVTSNLGSAATKQIFSPAAGGIVGVGQVPVVGAATLQVTGNVLASNALQCSNIAATSANSIYSNVTSNNIGSSIGINKSSPTSNLDVSGNVLITDTLTSTGIDQQLPAAPFTGTGTIIGRTNAWAYQPLNGTITDQGNGNVISTTNTGPYSFTTTGSPTGGPSLVVPAGSYITSSVGSNVIQIDQGLTVSFWVKLNASTTAGVDTFNFRGNGPYIQNFNINIRSNGTTFNLWQLDGSRLILSPAVTFTTGVWYNIVISINTSKLVTYYINGTSVASGSYTSTGTNVGQSFALGGPYAITTVETEYSNVIIYSSGYTPPIPTPFGAYINVANGVTFTVGATSETSGHESWRAVTTPITISSGVSVPSVGKFQLFEMDSLVVGNTLWSPNGRYYFTVNATTQTIRDYFLSTTLATVSTSTITSLYLTTAGFLQGVNSTGAIVYTSTNTVTGYGPYRFAMENQGFAAIYDRYNTILYQIGTTQTGWQTSGTYGGDAVGAAGGYRIHTFTTVGTTRFAIPNYIPSLSVDYLIVAGGGGGGGGWQGGGGGAGGLLAATTTLSNGVYTVTVGGAGLGLTSTASATNGGNSSLVNTIGGTAISQTAIGGGFGGFEASVLPLGTTVAAASGGSGGGGSWPTLTAGAGTVGQGFAGGTAFNGANYTGAGGGGAGAVGQDSTSTQGGNGGIGVASSITTVSTYYSGGGGGSARGAAGAFGGNGGGGNGNGIGQGSSASFYGGGGGAGGRGDGLGVPGGDGFQGIVIIRYLISSVAVSNAWGFASVPQTLTFSMPTLYLPTSLLIQGVDYNNSPNSANAFTFSGSTDGTNYNTLVSSSTYLSNTDYGYNIYSITTNTAWNYFQLIVTGADATPGYVNQMILNGQISWSPTANAVTTNVGAANVFSITGKVGINTSSGGATIQILGNVYASNALTGTIRSPLANTTTLNISSVYGRSGPVGFNVTPVASGPNLQFGSGNVYASNAISGQNVTVTTIQTYNEDLTRQSPHLRPTLANATAIQNWISASSNMTQRAGWSTSDSPTCSNVVAGPLGSSDYTGSVLLPDGRVLFVPANATNIGFYRPSTMEFSTLSGLGLNSTASKYSGGVLLPNGNVFFTPSASSNIGIFNPISSRLSNIGPISAAAQKFGGAVLVANGNVIMIPYQTSNIGIFNPTTGVYSNGVAHTAGAGAFLGGVLAPTGNVVLVPFNSSNVGMYDPVNKTYANVAPTTTTVGAARYLNGCIAQNGNIIFSQWSSANVGSFNPVTFAFSNLTTTGAGSFTGAKLLPSGNIVFVPVLTSANVVIFNPVNSQSSNVASPGGFGGASLLPNGSLVFVPTATRNVVVLNTLTPTSREFCMGPYVNSF